jgi:ubiquinone/menaquinone biosynthesis C-methylase UbiE
VITKHNDTNESAAATAFTRQSAVFDEVYGKDAIVNYKRRRVWEHVNHFLSPGSLILELNAGTGEDAIEFARSGHRVHATDLSNGMLSILQEKVILNHLRHRVTYEQCSFTKLSSLQNTGPYDLIFSNFAGLNCTNDLEGVLHSFDKLLKPGGHITLVLLPKFCLWESLLLFRGRFTTAIRRWTGNSGTKANVEGVEFRCWYYNPSFVRKQLGTSYSLKSLEGLCTIVPPSYLQNFSEKRPRLYRWLERWENKWKSKWPWRLVGDYYIITLEKI